MLGVEIAIIVLLLGLNAFLAASEISIVSARPARLRPLAEEGDRSAARVLSLKEDPSGFLATVQVGITLAGFFASAVGAVSLVEILSTWLAGAPAGVVAENAPGIALVGVTALLSFVSIIFGELVPKTLAVRRAEGLALLLVRPLDALGWASRPIVALLTGTTNVVLRLLGAEGRAHLPSVTQDELLAMLETAEDEGVVEAAEADLIEEAFQFGRTIARTIMVPRVDIVALEAATPVREAVDRFFSTGFSRLPVYRESLDAIVGVLYVRDVFRLVWTEPETAAKPVADVVRPAYFVPDTKPIDELLTELRARRTHLAICVDEYGGVAGLVTMEDVLEELVGEITDEFDPGYEPIRQVAPGVFDVDGRIGVRDLLDRLDLGPEAIGPFESESVGGLIADHLGRIPAPGDVVQTGALRLEVRAVTGRRVSHVRVEVANSGTPSDGRREAEA
ncbi:MAG: HlyC/CorC family transporter [Thermomicrobiaceae bacterium]|nr:HlyC/CorC family transporter [Thermomicrobiaceae bacterium]